MYSIFDHSGRNNILYSHIMNTYIQGHKYIVNLLFMMNISTEDHLIITTDSNTAVLK